MSRVGRLLGYNRTGTTTANSNSNLTWGVCPLIRLTHRRNYDTLLRNAIEDREQIPQPETIGTNYDASWPMPYARSVKQILSIHHVDSTDLLMLLNTDNIVLWKNEIDEERTLKRWNLVHMNHGVQLPPRTVQVNSNNNGIRLSWKSISTIESRKRYRWGPSWNRTDFGRSVKTSTEFNKDIYLRHRHVKLSRNYSVQVPETSKIREQELSTLRDNTTYISALYAKKWNVIILIQSDGLLIFIDWFTGKRLYDLITPLNNDVNPKLPDQITSAALCSVSDVLLLIFGTRLGKLFCWNGQHSDPPRKILIKKSESVNESGSLSQFSIVHIFMNGSKDLITMDLFGIIRVLKVVNLKDGRYGVQIKFTNRQFPCDIEHKEFRRPAMTPESQADIYKWMSLQSRGDNSELPGPEIEYESMENEIEWFVANICSISPDGIVTLIMNRKKATIELAIISSDGMFVKRLHVPDAIQLRYNDRDSINYQFIGMSSSSSIKCHCAVLWGYGCTLIVQNMRGDIIWKSDDISDLIREANGTGTGWWIRSIKPFGISASVLHWNPSANMELLLPISALVFCTFFPEIKGRISRTASHTAFVLELKVAT